jgi:hypothetical protein
MRMLGCPLLPAVSDRAALFFPPPLRSAKRISLRGRLPLLITRDGGGGGAGARTSTLSYDTYIARCDSSSYVAETSSLALFFEYGQCKMCRSKKTIGSQIRICFAAPPAGGGQLYFLQDIFLLLDRQLYLLTRLRFFCNNQVDPHFFVKRKNVLNSDGSNISIFSGDRFIYSQ